MMKDAAHCPFNLVGLLLCRMQIPFHRENLYFGSDLVSEVLSRSHALAMPKVPSLMRPNDYAHLSQLRCRFEGRLNELLARKELSLAAYKNREGRYGDGGSHRQLSIHSSGGT